MKLPWTTRTSLFARMSLLFGLLVTVPLIISGIVLSLRGSQIVVESGKRVAEIGSIAATNQSLQLTKIARETLATGAKKQAQVTTKVVSGTLNAALDASNQAFGKSAAQMSQRGGGAVSAATKEMGATSQQTLDGALSQLRRTNREALKAQSKHFSDDMNKELAKSADPIQTGLRDSLLRAWEGSAERRIGSIQDFDTRVQNQIVARLQLPLRFTAIIYPDENVAPGYLEKFIRKNATMEIVRAVLVSDKGTEIARVPQTDLKPDEEGEDWSDATVSPIAAATRTRFLNSPEPYLVEPIRYDERSKHWIRRIVHQVIQPDSGTDPPMPKPDAGQMPAMPKGKPETAFVVVDFALESLVELAASDTLTPGMVALMVKTGSGELISAYPKPEKDVGTKLLASIQKLGEPKDFTVKSTPVFDYQNGEGKKLLARARYLGEPNHAWVVVAQPETDILEPAQRLAKSINDSWGAALGNVQKSSTAFIDLRNERAQQNQRKLAADAKARMEREEAQQSATVRYEFLQDRNALVRDLRKQLSARVKDLQTSAYKTALKESEDRKGEAIRAVSKAVRDETDEAVKDIRRQSSQRANEAGGDILFNSAWLIPLFLVLALFLATMTAKSLVRPINQLVKGTQALTAGEFHQRIKVQGDDELARLALAFNEMAGAIERGQADLLQSHDTLVGEKTRMQGIVDSSPDGLVMLEPSGQIAFMNPAAIRLLDIPRAELPEAPFEIAQLPATPSARLQECLEVGQCGEGVQEFEIADPQRRVLQVRCVRLRSENGRSYGQLLHLHDITRERVIDEMKSDFISLVSHELRTPLTSILGFSSYMLTGKLGQVAETQKMALESIHRQAKRLSAIISDFLDISRIESGKIEMKKDPVPVAQVAGRVVEDLRPQATEKSIRVAATVVDGSLPLVAMGDDQRIAQIFTNLIGNALKFTEKDGRIDVLLSRSNGELVCKVKDSGCGIPEDELARVFDRFYQVEKVVTRKTGGTGLGLAIVKNIIEAHGGRVWIESEVGKGTTVSFTLPGAD